MAVFWSGSGSGVFRQASYKDERDFESAIKTVQGELFGRHRIYLDIKKKIGTRGGQRNIPDGYLLDLTARRPRLYVIENELARHDPLRHIAIQILQFSLSFEAERRLVRKVLFQALQERPDAFRQAEEYAVRNDFRNLDHMLDSLVEDGSFAALVIIDEAPEDLARILTEKFAFPVEVLELRRFTNDAGEHVYHFQPFLAEVEADIKAEPGREADLSEVNTIVVPARDDGFQETFLGEHRWYAIRLSATMRPQIRWVAVYRVAPTSAITHIAPVRSIEPWKDTGKYVIEFAEPAQPIGPIRLNSRGKVKAPQAPRYTRRELLDTARTLDDLWG